MTNQILDKKKYIYFSKYALLYVKYMIEACWGGPTLYAAGIHVPSAPRLGHGIPCPCLRPRPPIQLGATKGKIGGPWIILDTLYFKIIQS